MAPDRTTQPDREKGRRGPCPLCGGDSFDWGVCYPSSDMPPGRLMFTSDNVPGLISMFGLSGSDVQARAYQTCGNVQLFANQ